MLFAVPSGRIASFTPRSGIDLTTVATVAVTAGRDDQVGRFAQHARNRRS